MKNKKALTTSTILQILLYIALIIIGFFAVRALINSLS